MSNTLLDYDPIWYANRAIERLLKSLNMPRYMFRQYENEPRQIGSTIHIRKPGGFSAQSMPISTAEDITPTSVTVTLDQWWGVQVSVTDKELTYTGERYVAEHVAPMMNALAQQIETSCAGLYNQIPWQISTDGTNPNKDFTAARKILNDNFVPEGNRVFLYDTFLEEQYLNTALFAQANTSGDGGAVQRSGQLVPKFGFQPAVFLSEPTHTAGAAGGTPVAGAAAVGATTINVTGCAASGTVKKGDTFKIAGQTQSYVAAADATASTGTITGLTFTPPLAVATVGTEAITFTQVSGAQSFAMDGQAMALVMAPLSETGNGRGAEIAYAVDPTSGLSLRFSRYYVGKEAALYVRFDALWGVALLDGNRAVRVVH